MIEALPARSSMRELLEDVRRRTATTPGRLRQRSVAIAITAVCLMAIGSGTLVTALLTVREIQGQTLPAIVGMLRVHALLSEADRSAASAYLLGGNGTTDSQLVFDAEAADPNLDVLGRLSPDVIQLRYEADIAAASRELQRATTLNLGGDEVSRQLQTIAASVANYSRLIQYAMQSGQDFQGGTVYVEAASRLMHGPGGILTQVDAAEHLYAAGLDRDNGVLRVTVGIAALYALVAILVLLPLVRTQRFLQTRFRRRRNPRLLAATVLLLVIVAGSGCGALQVGESLRSAEDNSSSRLFNLWRARWIAYDADGQANLMLVSRIAEFEHAFQADSAQLVDRPLTDDLVQRAARGQIDFNGLLADQIRTASSPTEVSAALNALRAYQQYQQAHAAVQAKVLASTPAPGVVQSGDLHPKDAAFNQLDWEFNLSIQDVQAQFDSTMARAEMVLTIVAVLQVLTLAVVALTFWGLQPRIREYTAGASRLEYQVRRGAPWTT